MWQVRYLLLLQRHAPFLDIDNASAFGYFNGIVRITLEAGPDMPTPVKHYPVDRVIVADLRMKHSCGAWLPRLLIEGALLMAAPAAGASGEAPKPN